MSTILMPIKKEYSDMIFSGIKKYEFRKRAPKEKIDKVIVYESRGSKKVVGELIIDEIIVKNKEKLWQEVKEYTGTTKDRFDNYFKNQELAVAYKIKKYNKYNKTKDLSDFNINYIPQSYVYIKEKKYD